MWVARRQVELDAVINDLAGVGEVDAEVHDGAGGGVVEAAVEIPAVELAGGRQGSGTRNSREGSGQRNVQSARHLVESARCGWRI